MARPTMNVNSVESYLFKVPNSTVRVNEMIASSNFKGSILSKKIKQNNFSTKTQLKYVKAKKRSPNLAAMDAQLHFQEMTSHKSAYATNARDSIV
jgi:hypothetical protein